jgi:hypothetical protein
VHCAARLELAAQQAPKRGLRRAPPLNGVAHAAVEEIGQASGVASAPNEVREEAPKLVGRPATAGVDEELDARAHSRHQRGHRVVDDEGSEDKDVLAPAGHERVGDDSLGFEQGNRSEPPRRYSAGLSVEQLASNDVS